MTVLVGFEFECRRSSAGTAPFSQSRGHALEPVHNLSEILFIYSHILATVSLFSRPGQNCYIPLCYLSFQQAKKDPEQALRYPRCGGLQAQLPRISVERLGRIT